jgi:hypothetical protein
MSKYETPTASHDVEFTVPNRRLGKADVESAVYRNGEKHGVLWRCVLRGA